MIAENVRLKPIEQKKMNMHSFKKIKLFIVLILSLMFFACNNSGKKYKIAISDPSTSLNQVGVPIIKLLEKEMGIEFEILDQTSGSIEHLKLLSEGKIDFAIALTTVGVNEFDDIDSTDNDQIRTISPLYNQILFIIYPDSLKPKNLGDLIRGKKIGFGIEKGGTAGFTQNILKEFGVDYSEYVSVYTNNTDNYCNNLIDVSCSFTSFNNSRVVKMLREKNHCLFSLGDAEKAFNGSAVDGICKKLWTAKPFIIPKNSYYVKPEKSGLTVSVYTSLLCKKNLDTEFVHNITEIIIKNKATLIKQNPVINQISEDNLYETLYFPLHQGVHMFLDRNKPSFLEQYAEVMALILSIVIIMAGIISSYRKWNKQRKKDRIDVYYEQVLEIDRTISKTEDINILEQKMKILYELREQAFENLIKEKLSADESFKIYLDLTTGTIQKIERSLA